MGPKWDCFIDNMYNIYVKLLSSNQPRATLCLYAVCNLQSASRQQQKWRWISVFVEDLFNLFWHALPGMQRKLLIFPIQVIAIAFFSQKSAWYKRSFKKWRPSQACPDERSSIEKPQRSSVSSGKLWGPHNCRQESRCLLFLFCFPRFSMWYFIF